MIRVGDALVRAGRHREAVAVYRRAAHLFEAQHRDAHARGAWRLVLKVSAEDAEARERIVALGGIAVPTPPETRAGYATRIVQFTPEELERTVVGDEMWEITDAGADDPAVFERTIPMGPIGFVSTGEPFDLHDPEITAPSERTEPGAGPR
ncbi:MAG TPA: hypothetical protein VMV18_01745 [bacterium]|nr:hypothetical protein [bacterium]